LREPQILFKNQARSPFNTHPKNNFIHGGMEQCTSAEELADQVAPT